MKEFGQGHTVLNGNARQEVIAFSKYSKKEN